MPLHLHMEYWHDDDWFVGSVPWVPGLFSQGKTLDELKENILDAYNLLAHHQESMQLDCEITVQEIAVPSDD